MVLGGEPRVEVLAVQIQNVDGVTGRADRFVKRIHDGAGVSVGERVGEHGQ